MEAVKKKIDGLFLDIEFSIIESDGQYKIEVPCYEDDIDDVEFANRLIYGLFSNFEPLIWNSMPIKSELLRFTGKKEQRMS